MSDDTASIRAVVRLVSSSGGGVVYFPPGDYKIVASSALTRPAPVVVPSGVVWRVMVQQHLGSSDPQLENCATDCKLPALFGRGTR